MPWQRLLVLLITTAVSHGLERQAAYIRSGGAASLATPRRLAAEQRADDASLLQASPAVTGGSAIDALAQVEIKVPLGWDGTPFIFLDGVSVMPLDHIVENVPQPKSSNSQESTNSKDSKNSKNSSSVEQVDVYTGKVQDEPDLAMPKLLRLPSIKVAWPKGAPTKTWTVTIRGGPNSRVLGQGFRVVQGSSKQGQETHVKDKDGSIEGLTFSFLPDEANWEIQDVSCVAFQTGTCLGDDLAAVLDLKADMKVEAVNAYKLSEGAQEIAKDAPMVLYGEMKGKPLVRNPLKAEADTKKQGPSKKDMNGLLKKSSGRMSRPLGFIVAGCIAYCFGGGAI